jgi:hypothetical protein
MKDRRVEVVPASLGHALEVAASMTRADADDLRRGWGQEPEEAAVSAVCRSEGDSWAATVDGKAVLVFGVVDAGGEGNVWMMTGGGFEKIGLRFVRHSAEFLGRMTDKYGRIFGYVREGNETMLKWLKWSGFSFTDIGGGYVRCDKCAAQ